MARFRCPYGHTEVIRGQLRPLVHPSRPHCSIYVQLRREGLVDIFGRPVGGKDISAYLVKPGAAPASEPAPNLTGAGVGQGKPEATKPEAAPKKEPLLKRLSTGLGVKYREVTTTPPGAGGKPEGESDWLASEETTERFWQAIFGFIEQIVHLLTNFLEIPPVPEEVFTIDPGQSFVFRTALRPFTTNILKKVFGAKSPEQADRIVAGLSGLLGFGMMGMKIVIHFMINLPKSPKLQKFRERRAAAEAERKRRQAITVEAKPAAPDAGAAPVVRVPA